MLELSKKERKIARSIIETGIQREFQKGLNSIDSILLNWKDNKTDNRESYHLVYKTLTDFDKHIASRYDGMTGSKYLFIIAAQLNDGIITEDDLMELSGETIQKIKFMIQLI